MATRSQLHHKVQVHTKGCFLAEIDEVWREGESWLGGTVQLPDSPFSKRCFWNAAGTCSLGIPDANIDMTAPIGHVLRWHVNDRQ